MIEQVDGSESESTVLSQVDASGLWGARSHDRQFNATLYLTGQKGYTSSILYTIIKEN